jgi:hypothetical protein
VMSSTNVHSVSTSSYTVIKLVDDL